MTTLLDALGIIPDVLSMPGDYTRGLLAGKPGERMGGRDLLRHYGLAGPEDNWGNFAAGLGVDMATDPLTYLLAGVGGTGGANALLGKLGPRFGGGAAKLSGAVSAGGRPAQMAESLLASPNARRLLGEIPEGAQLLEGSNNALAFRTPQGDVLRMAQGKGGVAPASRAAIPEMAQPTRNVGVGDWRVERVPFADRVGDKTIYDAAYKDLAAGVRSAGGHPADLHPGNVGLLGERPVLIDPGAVVPHPRASVPLPMAAEMLGPTPFKYRALGGLGGAGLGASSDLLRELFGGVS